MFKRITEFLILILLCGIGIGYTSGLTQPSAPEGTLAEEIFNCGRVSWVQGTFQGIIKIDIFRPEFSRTFRMEVWQEGEEKAFVSILEPQDEAGSGYLSIGDDLWFYAPDVGFAIQLPSNVLSENLLGADLSLDDLSRGTLNEDFTIELVGTRSTTEDESDLDNDLVHLLKLTPNPDATVVFGKLELLIRASDCATLTINYFDQRETLIRQALFSDFALAGAVGQERVVPQTVIFDDLLNEGSRTVEVIESFELDVEFPPERFSLECLEDGQCGSSSD
jgi:hypothetical protein